MSEEARMTWVAISTCLRGVEEEVVLVAQQLCNRHIVEVFWEAF